MNESCSMIMTREYMLDLMRRLQQGEKVSSQDALSEEQIAVLRAAESYVSLVDDFGKTLFNRLGNMVRLLSVAMAKALHHLEDEYGEKITLRGTSYLQILEEN